MRCAKSLITDGPDAACPIPAATGIKVPDIGIASDPARLEIPVFALLTGVMVPATIVALGVVFTAPVVAAPVAVVFTIPVVAATAAVVLTTPVVSAPMAGEVVVIVTGVVPVVVSPAVVLAIPAGVVVPAIVAPAVVADPPETAGCDNSVLAREALLVNERLDAAEDKSDALNCARRSI